MTSYQLCLIAGQPSTGRGDPGSSYSGDYAAFFGPQIGMSGPSEATFTVSIIEFAAVPGPATLSLGLGLAGIARAARRRKK
jgi:hypothetical protein